MGCAFSHTQETDLDDYEKAKIMQRMLINVDKARFIGKRFVQYGQAENDHQITIEDLPWNKVAIHPFGLIRESQNFPDCFPPLPTLKLDMNDVIEDIYLTDQVGLTILEKDLHVMMSLPDPLN